MVILLVRMWVEREKEIPMGYSRWSHPPCEDVSWKKLHREQIQVKCVILLVRMWVERQHIPCNTCSNKSSSLWGCELKVSCFVWILHPAKSSSLWGCELKVWIIRHNSSLVSRHPPCEDVSWKSSCSNGCTAASRSSSLWGCELKGNQVKKNCRNLLSSSLWGCELKGMCSIAHDHHSGHPPCEDVSWKIF